MRKYYKLVNYEFGTLYKVTLGLCLAMAALQQFFLFRAMKEHLNMFERFEDLFSMSGCVVVFLICFISLTGLCIFNVYSNYVESKSIYTLLTLPQNREYMYFAKITAFLACYLVLMAAQVVSAGMGYILVSRRLSSMTATIEGLDLPIKNGLFLAFVRSEFFRILLPLGFKNLVSTSAMLITFVCSLYYGIICERSGKYLRIAPVFFNAGLIVYVLNYRINALSTTGYAYKNMYLLSFIMLCVTAFIIYDSIKLIKRGAIV